MSQQLDKIGVEIVVEGLTTALAQLRQLDAATTKSATNATARWNNVSKSMISAGKALSIGLTLPLVGIGAVALNSAIKFEDAFAGIRKTVDATEEEFATLSDQIRQMALEKPVSPDQLALIGEMGGALGVAAGDIEKFIDVVSDMGATTNLSFEEAADGMARFANIMGTPISELDRMGSTLVDLGNKTAATEAEILAMATRFASAGKTVGLTEDQVLGFSAALTSVGIEAEAGGTAISRAFIQMGKSVDLADDKLEVFARVAGLSVEQFSRLFKEDATAAMQAFLVGLNDVIESGGNVSVVLEDLELDDIRLSNAVRSLALDHDGLAFALDAAATAWSENSALQTEAEKRYATTASQLSILKNRANDVAISLGTALLPAFNGAIDAIQPLIGFLGGLAEGFAGLNQNSQTAILGLGALLAAAGPLSAAIGGLIKVIQGLSLTALGPLGIALGAATVAVAAFVAINEAIAGDDDVITLTKEQARGLEDLGEQAGLTANKLDDLRISDDDLAAAGEAAQGVSDDFREELEKLALASDQAGGSFDETRPRIDAMKAAIDEAIGAAAEASGETEDWRQKLHELGVEGIIDADRGLETLQASLGAVGEAFLRDGGRIEEFVVALQGMGLEGEALNAVLEPLGFTVDEGTGKITAFGQAVDGVAAQEKAREVGELGEAFDEAGREAEEFGGQLGALQEALGKVFGVESQEQLALQAQIATRKVAIAQIEVQADANGELSESQQAAVDSLQLEIDALQAEEDLLLAGRDAASAKTEENLKLAPSEAEVAVEAAAVARAAGGSAAELLNQRLAAGDLNVTMEELATALIERFGPAAKDIIEDTDLWAQSSQETKDAVSDMVSRSTNEIDAFARDGMWNTVTGNLGDVEDKAHDAEDAILRIPSSVKVDTVAAQQALEALRRKAREAAEAVLAAGGTISTQQGLAITGQHGIWDIPGPRGAGDTVPLMAAPGEMLLDPELAAAIRSMVGAPSKLRDAVAMMIGNVREMRAGLPLDMVGALASAGAAVQASRNGVAATGQAGQRLPPFNPNVTINTTDRRLVRAFREELRQLAHEMRSTVAS